MLLYRVAGLIVTRDTQGAAAGAGRRNGTTGRCVCLLDTGCRLRTRRFPGAGACLNPVGVRNLLSNKMLLGTVEAVATVA